MTLLVNLSLPITDPVLIFALVLLIILAIPLLFSRFRIPGIVGLVLAGVLIGPNALNLLARDATIVLLGTVGLLYIMFTAGLEIDLNRFNKYRNHSLVFGALTFFIPQIGGTLMAVYLLGFNWAPAILLASMFASHTLVAYPIASRLGITKNTAVTAAIGGTIITDTAALLVLAIVLAAERGDIGPVFWVTLIVSLSIYSFVVFWGLPRLGRWFFRNVSDGLYEFLFVLTAVFASAFLSEVAGVEAIIGAFMAGLALNRLIPEHSALMNRIQFVGNSLFIPFFLISVGMLVDVRVLFADVDAWAVAGAMVVTAVTGKWLAAQGSGYFLKYTRDEVGAMFGLSVAQAAATLAVVLIAFEVGIFGAFGDAVLNGAILMILVTCILAPLLTERYGRRLAIQEAQKPYEPSEAPQRILVPLANPVTAPALMDLAFLVHAPDSHEPIFPLKVARDGDDVKAQVAAGEKVLSHAVIHGSAADFAVVPVTRIDMNVAAGISRAIKEKRISNVIIGWSGHVSANERVFGSVLDQLLHQTREMIMVCRLDRPLNTTNRIIAVAPPFIEREPGFSEAFRAIKIMADQLGASLLFSSTGNSVPVLQELAERLKPEIPLEVKSVDRFAHVINLLDTEVKMGDTIVLFSVRERTIAWRPGLDRMPRIIAGRFDANFLVIYPAEVPLELLTADPGAPHDYLIPEMLEKERAVLGLSGFDEREALRRIVSAATHNPHGTDEIVDILMQNAPDYVPELMPGVMLFHAHHPEVTEQIFALGISPDGLNLRRASTPVHVILVLLNPANLPAEQHLQALAGIARIVTSGQMVEQLRSAQSIEEVRQFLTAAV